MKKISIFAAALVVLGGLITLGLFAFTSHANASGISMAPLKYQSDLNGKVKKGAVDISNRSGYAQKVTVQIRAFKQVDNKGALGFYEDPLISAGITPDYDHFTLKPNESIHLFFQLNGHRLPKKQIFAAILAQAQPIKASYNITPVLRVGTLLILKNGNGDPPKQGEISGWNVSLFQLGDSVNGSFDFKNTEKGDRASGYFPNFTMSGIGNAYKFRGNLLFPGIERQQQFELPGSRIGIYNLTLASDANAGASQWVVVLTGYWRWLLPLIVIALVTVVIVSIKFLRKPRRSGRKK